MCFPQMMRSVNLSCRWKGQSLSIHSLTFPDGHIGCFNPSSNWRLARNSCSGAMPATGEIRWVLDFKPPQTAHVSQQGSSLHREFRQQLTKLTNRHTRSSRDRRISLTTYYRILETFWGFGNRRRFRSFGGLVVFANIEFFRFDRTRKTWEL